MGQLKKLVPSRTRTKIAEKIDDTLPDGLIRKQSANIISATGASLVVAGSVVDSRGLRKTGAGMRCIGETTDDIDGDWARRFNIASETGAIVDVTLDKVKVAAEVYTLWRHAKSFEAPEATKRRRRIAFVAGKHSLNAALNLYIAAKGGETSSSAAGKANMWADGLFFGGATISDSSESPKVVAIGNTISDIGFASGVLIGTAATLGYAKQAFSITQNNPDNVIDLNKIASEQAAISGHAISS